MPDAFCKKKKPQHLCSLIKLLFTTFTTKQTASFLAFISHERSEWAEYYSRDEKTLRSSKLMVQSEIKVHKILSQLRDIWEIAFDVVLTFSVTTQIMATKQTRFVIHSSKGRVERYISGPVELYWAVFCRTAGCNLLGKPPKNRKMHWTKQSEKPSSLLTKTENRRQNWRKPSKRARHQKLSKSAKPKIPTRNSIQASSLSTFKAMSKRRYRHHEAACT